MINFQPVMSRLLNPAGASPELAARPAIIQAASPARGVSERTVSYADLKVLTERAFCAYRRAGVGDSDAVVLCAPNSPELVAGIMAAWAIGATAIPVDCRLTANEVENIANRVKAKIVYSPRFPCPGLTMLAPSVFESGAIEEDADLLANLKPETLGLVILTSGTTGVPKGAVHDLGSLVDNFIEISQSFGLADGTRAWLPLPVSHIFGMQVLLAVMSVGGAIIFDDFAPAEFWKSVEQHKPSMVVGVPTIYGALLSLPHPGEVCRCIDFYLSGGAPLSESLSEQFQGKFGKSITQGYGATETKVTTINANGPADAVGRPIPSVTIEIVDESDRALANGETGEIRVSGACLMQCYLNQPEETAKVLHDGHYHTGDIGYFKDGWLFISGRSKEMIIVAGNKVFPIEVESVLRNHPLVSEIAVFGVPHRKLGQIIKAVIVVSPGQLSDRLSAGNAAVKEAEEELKANLRDFCAQNLKRELRPMDWEFRPASQPLPKTHTGKIDKKQLQTVSV